MIEKLDNFNYSMAASLLLHILTFIFLTITIVPKIKNSELNNSFVIIDSFDFVSTSNFRVEKNENIKSKYSAPHKKPLSKTTEEAEVRTKKKEDNIVNGEKIEYTPKAENNASATREVAQRVATKSPSKKPVIKEEDAEKKILDSLLKDITTQKKVSTGSKQQGLIGVNDQKFNKNQPEIANILEVLRGRFIHCWTPPIAALSTDDAIVAVYVKLDHSGNATLVKVQDSIRYKTDISFKAMADSAVRAIYKCSPIKGLDDKYFEFWNEIEMVFDPKDMI